MKKEFIIGKARDPHSPPQEDGLDVFREQEDLEELLRLRKMIDDGEAEGVLETDHTGNPIRITITTTGPEKNIIYHENLADTTKIPENTEAFWSRLAEKNSHMKKVIPMDDIDQILMQDRKTDH